GTYSKVAPPLSKRQDLSSQRRGPSSHLSGGWSSMRLNARASAGGSNCGRAGRRTPTDPGGHLLANLDGVRGHTIWTPGLGPHSIVLDAGAHRGEFSRGLMELYGCMCYLLEPNPALAAELQQGPFAGVMTAALGVNEGHVDFSIADNP